MPSFVSTSSRKLDFPGTCQTPYTLQVLTYTCLVMKNLSSNFVCITPSDTLKHFASLFSHYSKAKVSYLLICVVSQVNCQELTP